MLTEEHTNSVSRSKIPRFNIQDQEIKIQKSTSGNQNSEIKIWKSGSKNQGYI